MAKKRRVPVRVRRVPSAYEFMRDPHGRLPSRARRTNESPAAPVQPRSERERGRAPTPDEGQTDRPTPDETSAAMAGKAAAEVDDRAPRAGAPAEPDQGGRLRAEELDEWRDRALRLQAEMENFRRRQRLQAEERIREDRERLLRNFLAVADDLERALSTDGATSVAARRLHEGIELTYQGLLQLLEREGVEPIPALGQPFDPTLHEGIATIPCENTGLEPNTVAKVVQTGYRIDDRLLRPARVIVTQ